MEIRKFFADLDGRTKMSIQTSNSSLPLRSKGFFVFLEELGNTMNSHVYNFITKSYALNFLNCLSYCADRLLV